MSFPRYQKYKDSGVEWLGQVPDHWDVLSLGRVTLDKCDGPFGSGLKSEHYTDSGVRVVRLQNIRGDGFDGSDAAFIDEQYYRDSLGGHDVQPGDLLIAGLGDDRNVVGRACIAPAGIEPAMVKADCFRFRLNTRRALNKFVAMQLTAGSAYDAGMLSSGSTRSRISLLEMATRRVALPSMDEQSAIVAFLDGQMARINALVQEQLRLIELLEEKRQAVISRTVTKGLNPNVHMKNSGIEWLGEVPEHWEVRRLGTLFSEAVEEGNEELPILSVSIHDGVSDKELREDELDRKVTRSDDRTKYKQVQPGDLVYNMMRAWQGGFGAVTVRGMVSPAYVVARPRNTFSTHFIEYLLRTPNAVEEMRRHSHGVTDFRLRLYWDEFKALTIALPPPLEQSEIVEAIRKEIGIASTLISAAETAISLLQERRSALVTVAVTGKIDVSELPKAEAA